MAVQVMNEQTGIVMTMAHIRVVQLNGIVIAVRPIDNSTFFGVRLGGLMSVPD
ncbi:hypothetical protein [Shinella oryzae]|uniref:Uncharacterized protein n=1 Tax=Shinella oryzae TaxID=2871820 RepID=A0ABY9K9L3_9HYPH|nr:hypothetical protein [Shinella oryzae]WLS05245.1 hypothetical protein Q9315_24135 [Shinella oryzae]